jgi:hypothetical protein
MINPEHDIIDELILSGALEASAVDENGEMLYSFTQKLKDVNPTLYKEHLNFVNSEIMFLWQQGFLFISDLSEENPIISVTQKAFDQEEIDQLDEDKRRSLLEIKRVLKVL